MSQESKQPTTQKYIFGYGSLICPHSRGVTCPELKERASIPVVIQGIERTWSKRSVRGMTAMGVRFRNKARCAGIIVPVESQTELEMFDEREFGYERKLVPLNKVEKVPFLKKRHVKEEHNDFFETLEDCLSDDDDNKSTSSSEKDDENDSSSDDSSSTTDNIEVYVYVPLKTLAPTDDKPIVQSYVDTILRGCMAVGGEPFCEEFLKTTAGWHPEEWDSAHYDDKDRVNQVWINDRESPVYRRGDPEHSRENAHVFDSLLTKYRSEYLYLRVENNHDSADSKSAAAAPPKNKQPQQLPKHRETSHTAIRRTHTTKASLRSDARSSYNKKKPTLSSTQ